MIASLKKLWWILSAREKRHALVVSLLLLFNGLLEMVGVGMIPVYVSMVAYPDKLIDHEITQRLLATPGEVITQEVLLYWGSVLFLLFFTFKFFFTIFLNYWQVRFVQNRVLRISDELFSHYMRAPYIFHLGRNTAQLLRNLNFECARLGNSFLMVLIKMATHVFVLLCITGLLLANSPVIALLSLLVFFVVAAVVSALLHNKVKQLGLEAQDARGEVVRSVNEGLGCVKEIKVLKRESAFVQRFRYFLNTNMMISRFMQVIGRIIPSLMEWIAVTGLIAIILVLFLVGETSETVVSTVVLFAVSLMRIKNSMGTILHDYTTLQHNFVSVDVVYNDLKDLQEAMANESANKERANEANGGQGQKLEFRQRIELENIYYRYPNAQDDALKNVSLVIEKGEAIGFVGSTGAGKSTLIDIVLGVLTPSDGRLLLDGFNVQGNMQVWQRRLGYIPQSIYLVDGSIRQNIALGLPEDRIDENAVKRAVRAAHLEEFVERLPEKIDTVVGERGVRLSGGQRQRVAIARALYHDPEVLVMDEATSALDNVTERAVIKAVDALKGERTILMIAHRLSTVKNCDRIVLLEHGRVDSVGSYDELLVESEAFRKMAEA